MGGEREAQGDGGQGAAGVVLTMFLTDAELKELTGYRRPSAIRRWLAANGYRFEESSTGWPRVLRSTVCARLGDPSITNEPRLRLA